jgi:hypothetical protein
MQPRKTTAFAGLLLTAHFAFADSSYQTTSQITGGQFVDEVKNVAFISKEANKMFAPTNRIIMVHGNKKATVSKEYTEIIDLDKGEMIHIDNTKKTYTITTFDQMRKLMTQMAQKQPTAPAAQPQAQLPANVDIKFDTSVNNTGVTKVVNGMTAQEQVITMKMTISMPPGAAGQAAPQSSGQAAGPQTSGQAGAQDSQPTSMTYTVTTDCWIAPDPPEIKEIQDFDKRMGEKMMQGVDMQKMAEQMKANLANSNAAMAQMFGGHPGSAQAMEQMQKEMAKIKGTRILQVMSMGGDAPAQAPAASTSQPQEQSQQTQQQGSAAGQVASGTATGTAEGESSHLGAVGSALTNSVFGAFHKKKQQPAQQPAQQQTASTTAPASSAPATQHVVLMEMTDSMTNFSQEPVPESAFEIPAGYKQIQLPMGQ